MRTIVADCTCPCERRRLENLLHRLRESGSLKDVPLELLLEPSLGTRPSVKLVVHYPRRWQVIAKSFSLADIIAWMSVPVFFSFAGMAIQLDGWLPVGAGFVVAAGALLLSGRLSWTRDDLALDLNELSYAPPGRLRQVPWCEVYTATRRNKRWVQVALENGTAVFLRVPTPGDRDLLVGIMRELIRLHHQDLHGLKPAEGARASNR